jgi:predicted MFS family arabinose efflux permease
MDRSLPLSSRRPAGASISHPPHRKARSSHWPTVLLILGAGIASACQVGKVPVVLAGIQQSLAIDLPLASWLLSAFALVGAVLGVWIGTRVDVWGARRAALVGLAVQGLCSGLGALAPTIGWLLALRVVEGVGFLAVVVAAPALIVAATPRPAQPGAFAAWGMFMPLGIAAMMLTAPWIDQAGWRALWAANGALLLLYLWPMAFGTRPLGSGSRVPQAGARTAGVRTLVGLRGPWLIAALFALFTAMYFSVFGFLPSILTQRLGMSEGDAGIASAAVVVMSAIGNLVCGALLARGIAPMRLLAWSFFVVGASAPGILVSQVPAMVTYASCLAVSLVTGLIPVILFAAAPRHAPSPGQVGVTMGLAMQGNNLGLLAGPAVAGAIAATWGWAWIAAWVGLLAAVALLLVRALRRATPEDPFNS